MTAPRPGTLRDGLLLAVGTLTVLRVPAPRLVDRSSAAVAMAAAPLAVAPLAAAVAGGAWLGRWSGLPPAALAVLLVGLLALGTRALHWDGLADTADGLTASYERERALAVMRTGDVGPAGTVAVVLVAALQIVALAAVVGRPHGWLAVGVLVLASRSVLTVACVRGLPSARAEGLGATVVGTVPVPAAVAVAAVGGALSVGATALLGSPWAGLVGWLAMLAVVALMVLRCVRRLGGLTGDVLGAGVEVGFAVLLVAASAT